MRTFNIGSGVGVAVALVTMLVCIASVCTRAAEPLRLAKSIRLPNVEGRIDHMAVDLENRHLLVAALGNNSVEVIDLSKNRVIKSIAGLREPQGIAVLKHQNAFAVACGEDGKCHFFDAKTFQPRSVVELGDDADNVRYDSGENRVYVGFGAGAVGIVDAATRKRIADVSLAGHPESFQLETKGPRIYVNVPTAQQIAVIDRKQAKVIATWALDGARANFPMALDEAGRRLFVGCRTPVEVLVYDTGSGKLLSTFSTVGDTDDLFFDARTHRLYVCGGEGFVNVYEARADDKFVQIAKTQTSPGARTGLFVPELAQLFVAVPHRGGQNAELRILEVAH
jgi:YVTN family beta-propeller protein